MVELEDPSDSAVFNPYDQRAYDAIMAYKRQLEAGYQIKERLPEFSQLTRQLDKGDGSLALLGSPQPSSFHQQSFFFLGGAPFMFQKFQEYGAAYVDESGKPERHIATTITENAGYLMNFVYRLSGVKTAIQFGPPLDSYESGPQDIRGIGSLIHQFKSNIPVWILTKEAVVSGRLYSIRLKLVAEGLGCISDQPLIEFATSKDIVDADVLGVIIPGSNSFTPSWRFTEKSESGWTADLDGDGFDDLACVYSSFEGIASDMMSEVLWFLNIKGAWQILDWGRELDCT